MVREKGLYFPCDGDEEEDGMDGNTKTETRLRESR